MRLPLLLFLRGSALLRKSSRKAATPTHLLTATSSNASSSLAAPAVPCAVLLVGEGDFSYAADACRRRAEGGGSSVVGTAPSILATTLDSEAELKERFPSSASMVRIVEESGSGIVEYLVDATNLAASPAVAAAAPFDVIRWNFPHVPGKSNNKLNRELLRDFLRSAAPLLRRSNTGNGTGSNGHRAGRVGVVRVALAEGQGGTGSHGERATGERGAVASAVRDETHWTRSWMASVAAAEAGSAGAEGGLALARVRPFHELRFDDGDEMDKDGDDDDEMDDDDDEDYYYIPQGARGRSKRFDPRARPMVHEFRFLGDSSGGAGGSSAESSASEVIGNDPHLEGGRAVSLQHCYATELHAYVPVDWDPALDDAPLEAAIRAELRRRANISNDHYQQQQHQQQQEQEQEQEEQEEEQQPRRPFAGGWDDRALEEFAAVHDYCYPCGRRRARAWRVVLRAAPLSRADAHALWEAIRTAAAEHNTTASASAASSSFGGDPLLELRNKSSCTVSKPLPCWAFRRGDEMHDEEGTHKPKTVPNNGN